MLTVHQSDILALLADFKCLRYSHVRKYTAAKHGSTDGQLARMLNQLVFMGKVKMDRDYVMLPGRKMEGGIIKAFDLVTDLTDGRLEFICRGTGPVLLVFSARTGHDPPVAGVFGVINVEWQCESAVNRCLPSIDREMTVIFILSGAEQRRLIKTDNRHYFAVRDENGRYKFFKTTKKAEEAYHA